jgi:hypothetical protein
MSEAAAHHRALFVAFTEMGVRVDIRRTTENSAEVLEHSRRKPSLTPVMHGSGVTNADADALLSRIAELSRENEQLRAAAEAPLLPAPDALMSDWGEVGPYPGIPDDFGQLMTGDETLEQAVERMTLGVDELLDMATVLSDQSLELALCTVPPERVNEWTEKLITEKARLRRLRGTVDENFGRENLVSRVQGMFAQVGAKR